MFDCLVFSRVIKVRSQRFIAQSKDFSPYYEPIKINLSVRVSNTAYLVLVKYILTGRDAHPTKLSEYSFVPHLAAKGCICPACREMCGVEANYIRRLS